MTAFAGLAQLEYRAACHHLAAMAQERIHHLFQVQQPGLTVHDGDHVDAKTVLHLGVFVQLVEQHVGILAAFQLDHRTHPGLVRFVADFGDAFQAFLANHLADLHQQIRLVHLIGQLVDDDRLTLATTDVLEVAARTHDHATASCAIPFLHPCQTVDETGGRKIGRGHIFDQLLDIHFGILEQRETRIDHFSHVVRRNIGRHTHRDAGRTVHQQVGEARREHQRLMFRTVVVRPEIHRFLVQVGQQFMRDPGHADFGITHRRRVIPVHRTEVTLPVHQHVTQGERLSHTNDGVIHGGIAMRMVFTDDVADDTRRFLVSAVPVVRQLVHGKQHAAMHGLQAIAYIRQRASDNHAHRIVQVGLAHFFFQADRQGFFSELFHVYMCS